MKSMIPTGFIKIDIGDGHTKEDIERLTKDAVEFLEAGKAWVVIIRL